MKNIIQHILFDRFLLSGSESHDVRIVELNKNGIIVTLFDGSAPAPGDHLYVIRADRPHSRWIPRRIIGRVRILDVLEPGRIRVELLQGKIVGGTHLVK